MAGPVPESFKHLKELEWLEVHRTRMTDVEDVEERLHSFAKGTNCNNLRAFADRR